MTSAGSALPPAARSVRHRRHHRPLELAEVHHHQHLRRASRMWWCSPSALVSEHAVRPSSRGWCVGAARPPARRAGAWRPDVLGCGGAWRAEQPACSGNTCRALQSTPTHARSVALSWAQFGQVPVKGVGVGSSRRHRFLAPFGPRPLGAARRRSHHPSPPLARISRRAPKTEHLLSAFLHT